ncbi:MAG: DNRLRE domain-containing protein [Clostridia bacterium]|nr:DNRLRE domain-containing protein [Clostridia bacterium]
MKKRFKILLAFILSIALVVTHIPLISAEEIFGSEVKYNTQQEEITQQNEDAYILGELIEKRSNDTKHFRMSDGSIKACVYPHDVHYLKNGNFEDIDNTLIYDEEKQIYKNKANSANISLPENFSDGYVEYLTENGFVKFKLVGSTNKKMKKLTSTKVETIDKTVLNKVNSRVAYNKIKTDIDVQYDIMGDVLKETIILNKKTKETFVFEILTSAYNAVLNNDNSVSFFDEEGTQIYRMESPYMADSVGEFTNSIKTELIKKGDIYYLTYAPDYEWLSDKSRVYPVYLDPTLFETIVGSAISDTYVSSGIGSGDIRGGWDVLNIGIAKVSNGALYTMRAYIKFDIPAAIKPTDRIVSAKLDMVHYTPSVYTSNNGIRIDVHELTSSFAEGTTWWGNKPTFDTTIIDYVNVNTNNSLGNTGLTYDSYDITKLVSRWHSENDANYGVMLKLHDELSPTGNSKVFYYASDSVYHGKTSKFIEIVYRDTTGLEDYWSYTSLPAGRYGTAYVNNYSGNLVVTQPDYGIDGNRMPVSISHVYNTSNDVVDTYGGRWRLNYQMSIQAPSNLPHPYFVDADGTKHYFYQESSSSPVIDEDGLGYTLTTNSSSTTERYVITDKGKNKMYFNSAGKLTKIADAVGNAAIISYNSSGNISTITDGAGRIYQLAYTSGILSSITAPDGKVVKYTYNSAKQLTSIIYPDENENSAKTTFAYSDTGLISRINRPDGQRLDLIYNDSKAFCIYWYDKYVDIIKQHYFYYSYNETRINENYQDISYKYQYQFDTFGHTTGIINLQGDQAQNYVFNGVSIGGKSHKITSESKIQKSVTNLLDAHRLDSGPYTLNKYETPGQTMEYYYDSEYYNITGGSYRIFRYDTSGENKEYAYIYYDYIAEKTGYYTFSAYVSTDGISLDGSGATIRMARIVDGEEIDYVERGQIYTGSEKWERISVTNYFEEGDTIRCLMGGSDCLSSGYIWFDDFQLEEGETTNSYNLLSNTDFNDGTANWSNSTNATVAAITDNYAPQSTEKGIKLSGLNSQNYASQTLNMQGNAGDVFSAGAWAKAFSVITNTQKDAPDTARLFGISVLFTHTDGTTSRHRIPFNSFCNDWQFTSGAIVAPKDYNQVRFDIDYRNNENTAVFTLPYLYKEDYGQTYTYDDDGNVISSVDLAASETSFAYNDNQLAKIFSPSGTNYSYTYDETNNLLKYALSSDGIMEEFTYDSAGNALSATTWSMPIASAIEAGKTYYIVNAKTRTTLTAMGEAIRAQIQGQSFEKNDKHQKWTLTATSDGYYNIDVYLGSSNTNFRLDVPNGADTNNLGMIIHNPNTSNAQKYQIIPNSDGTFTIYTRASNFTKCLDALADNTSGAKDGIQVVQSNNSSADKAQKWYFYEADSVTESANGGKFINSMAEYTEDNNYLLKTIDAFGNVIRYDYNTTSGLLNKVIDSEGNETVYTYNSDNSIKSVTSQRGTYINMSVNYTYLNDLLTQIKVLNGTVYNFVYDTFGRTDEIKVGTALLSDITYNSDGTICEMRYGNGAYINYLYDDMGRTKYKYYNGDYIDRIEYYYNANGNLGVVVDYITNETTRYIYDLSSRLAEVEVYGTASLTDTNVVKSIKYTYADKTNYLTEVEYDSPLGTQSYNYNYGDIEDGEMPDAVYSVEYNGATRLEYAYDGFGRLTERKISRINKTQSFTYKQGGHGANSTSALVETVTVDGETKRYTYDANGNIIMVQTNDALECQYQYNSKNELVLYEIQDGINTYSYDNNGNITSAVLWDDTVKTFSYTDPNWPDKLTAFNGNTIIYDAIGNPQSYYDWKQMDWDNGRQLVEILEQENLYQYTYDGDGIRTSKNVNGTLTEFIYADGVLLGQTTEDDTLIFLYDESGNKFGFVYNGAYYYYDINLQGDVVGIYNSNGVKVVTYEYDPWGVITNITDTSGIDIGTINPIRYRGYYYDNETGFYYLQSRYYDPNICRFINADGYVSTGQGVLGYNMFAYCNNNPVMGFDPLGEWTFSVNWSFSAFLIGGATYSFALAYDSTGNFALQTTKADVFKKSSGGTFGLASIGFEKSYSYTKFKTIDSLNGIALNAGGSLPVCGPVSISGEAISPLDEPDLVGGSVGVGIGLGADLHATVGITETKFEFNIFKTAKNIWKTIVSWF